MTLPDPAAPRKHRRRWLWFPWLLFVVVIVGWTGGWFWLRSEAAARMDAGAGALRQAGYPVAWDKREIGGFPFRLEVTLTNAAIAEPSGWGVRVPVLKGEAPVYALDKWLFNAPGGMTLTRPHGGPLAIKGDMIRASLSQTNARPPLLAFQVINGTFAPAPGAKPFPVHSAARLELHTRPGPDDQGEVVVWAEGARIDLPGLLARVAEGRPVDFAWDMVLTRMSAFDGPRWPAAARAWSAAGGRAMVKKATLTAGRTQIAAASDALAVDANGRVAGTLDLSASQGAGPGFAGANLVFAGGQTKLGPIAIAPAPRVY